MPSPNQGERKDDFISRCMGSDEANEDFPDQSQRYAFCMSQWENKRAGDGDGIIAGMDKATLSGQITKVDEELRIAYGWFSVIQEDGRDVVDSQGDVIKEGTLLKAVHDFIVDSRAGKVMHRGRRVADIVESMVFTKDVQAALGIDLKKVGWFGAMKFRDEDAWKGVKSGKFKAFSIGGIGTRREMV